MPALAPDRPDECHSTPDHVFAADPDRRARFELEARLLASLNHPNVGALYGVEESDGTLALVMELVEGPTLAELITSGRREVPGAGEGLSGNASAAIEDSLRIARQIADALEAAHEKGIVHRDLKPANVKVTADGTIKVLDFGLAKVAGSGDVDVPGDVADSPTLSLAGTMQGLILGTAGYMAPEQARGEVTDQRADVWAFGVVLFEMLTGRTVFDGRTTSDVLAAVLRADPDWTLMPANLHPRLRMLLERCLEKNPRRRYQGIADAKVDLDAVLADPRGVIVSPESSGTTVGTRPTWRAIVPWAAAVALVAGAAGWLLRPVPEADAPAVVRFQLPVPDLQGWAFGTGSRVAVSPDGTSLAYVVQGRLYVRPLDETEPRLLASAQGSDVGPMAPAFSPDGQSIAYLHVVRTVGPYVLKRVPVVGGAPVTLAESDQAILSLTWPTPDGLVFSRQDGVMRISSNGGAVAALVTPSRPGEVLAGASLLPGGQRVLFASLPREPSDPRDWDAGQVFIQSVGNNDRTLVVDGGSHPTYLPGGHLLYARGDTLFAQAMNPETGEVAGGPVPLVEGLQRSSSGTTDTANYAVSATGTLVSLWNGAGIESRASGVLALVDRAGTVSTLPVRPGRYRGPRVSPDGRQLAVELIDDEDHGQIWIGDLSGVSQMRRLTRTGHNTRPTWTRDGTRVTFASERDGVWGIYEAPADGSALPTRLMTSETGPAYPDAWSPDGQTLLFTDAAMYNGRKVRTWSRADGSVRPFAAEDDLNQFGASFSPDGRWVAYTTVADDGIGIRVQPFPRTEVIRQVTEDGEVFPVWSADGTTLLFRLRRDTGQPAQLMGLDVNTTGTLTFRNPRNLPVHGALLYANYRDYDLMPDGRRLLVIVPSESPERATAGPEGPRLDVVLNWTEELNARVPVP